MGKARPYNDRGRTCHQQNAHGDISNGTALNCSLLGLVTSRSNPRQVQASVGLFLTREGAKDESPGLARRPRGGYRRLGVREQTDLVPAGEDPEQIAAAIAARGNGEGPAAPEIPEEQPTYLTACAKVAIVAGAVCLAAPVVVVLIFLKAKMNSAPTSSTP
jgi:hypothetical protein